MSSDGDFPAFSGNNCLSLSLFVGGKLTITSSSKATMEKAISYLPPESYQKIKMEVPPSPIFEGVANTRLRCLIGVIIGCDVSPGV